VRKRTFFANVDVVAHYKHSTSIIVLYVKHEEGETNDSIREKAKKKALENGYDSTGEATIRYRDDR